MQIREIAIKNIGCLESLVIKPKALTVLEGKNGVGKSTIVNALTYLGEKSHDPSLIRKGCESGEIRLTIGDQGGEYDGAKFVCTITPEKTSRVLHHPKLGKIPVGKSKEWIESVINMVSFDPVRILTAKPEDQLTIFLKAAPLRVTADQLGFLTVSMLNGKELDRHALEVLEEIRSDLYDARTGVNKSAKDKRATARQMTETLPAMSEDGQDWGDVLKTTTDEYRALQRDTQARIEAIKKDAVDATQAQKDLFAANRDAVKSVHESEIENLRKEFDKACEKMRGEALCNIADLRTNSNELISGIEDHKEAALKAVEADYQPRHKELTEKLGQAKAMVEAHAKAEATRSFISDLDSQAEKLESQSKQLGEQINQVDGMKATLLKSLPIPGMEIADGELAFNGIPFHRVNDAERHRLALEMARLRVGPLGFLVLDRAEIFDDESWELVKQAAVASGMQVMAARRSKGNLSVTTGNGEAA